MPEAGWDDEPEDGTPWRWWGGGRGDGFDAGAAPPRTLIEGIGICLTKDVEGKGRVARSDYWLFALFQFLAGILTGSIAALFLLLPSITNSVPRLHDIGRSGWTSLLSYCTVKPGEPGPNPNS